MKTTELVSTRHMLLEQSIRLGHSLSFVCCLPLNINETKPENSSLIAGDKLTPSLNVPPIVSHLPSSFILKGHRKQSVCVLCVCVLLKREILLSRYRFSITENHH